MITLVFGLPGSGKSTLARSLLRPPYVAVDRLGEMPGRWLVRSYPRDALLINWREPDQRAVWVDRPAWSFFSTLRGYTLLLDEADLLWPSPSMLQPGRPEGVHPCADLVARHRHYGVRILASTQRPMQTPPLVRDLAGEVYCFALASEAAAYVRKYWGLEPPKAPYQWVRWRMASAGGLEHAQGRLTRPGVTP